jgi:hypothetical protein
MTPTPLPEGGFAEPDAAAAYLNGDHTHVAAILDGMLPGELAEFAVQLADLRAQVLDVRFRMLRVERATVSTPPAGTRFPVPWPLEQQAQR